MISHPWYDPCTVVLGCPVQRGEAWNDPQALTWKCVQVLLTLQSRRTIWKLSDCVEITEHFCNSVKQLLYIVNSGPSRIAIAWLTFSPSTPASRLLVCTSIGTLHGLSADRVVWIPISADNRHDKFHNLQQAVGTEATYRGLVDPNNHSTLSTFALPQKSLFARREGNREIVSYFPEEGSTVSQPTLMPAPTHASTIANRGSSISQHLCAVKDLLRGAVSDAGYVYNG